MLYNLFPNTVLAYTQDHCGVFTSFPVSPDEALINVSVLVDPVERAKKPESYWEKNQDLILAALDEDFTVGASIQAIGCDHPGSSDSGTSIPVTSSTGHSSMFESAFAFR